MTRSPLIIAIPSIYHSWKSKGYDLTHVREYHPLIWEELDRERDSAEHRGSVPCKAS